MKTIKDLEFKPHSQMDGLQGRMDFDNGYGISVVRFKIGHTNPVADMVVGMCAVNSNYGSYTDNENEWEVAVFKDGNLCYDTPITNDVIGHCSDEDVTRIMKQIQLLKNK